jgi:catechol 2,3-dioxygenase-like lactoylglutathione lyase family enzyme
MEKRCGSSAPQDGKRCRMSMDHVSLTVRSVDRSIEFYKAVGLKVLRVTRLRRTSGEEYRNAYMYSGRFMLELLPVAGPKQERRRLPRSIAKALHASTGITHLGMRVHNLDIAIKRLKAAGATMIGEPFEITRETVNIAYFDEKADRAIHYVRKPKRTPWRIALFRDPDGATVELVQR